MTMATRRDEAARTEAERRLGVLLDLAEPADAERAAARLGLSAQALAAGQGVTSEAGGRAEALRAMAVLASGWRTSVLPASALGWLLERDDPELNALLIQDYRIGDGIKRDILHGVPFGAAPVKPGARPLPAIPVAAQAPWGFEAAYPTFHDAAPGPGPAGLVDPAGSPGRPGNPGSDPNGLIGALRAIADADRIGPARRLARQVSRADWEPIAAADREQPLSGYAHWALSQRPDCPEWLREQFGSWQPHFVKRFRKAGIIRDLTGFLTEESTAAVALQILGFGRWAFRERAAESFDRIGGLVRDELGGNLEAWAVVAQLLPDFKGTLPELLVTAGAIAYGG